MGGVVGGLLGSVVGGPVGGAIGGALGTALTGDSSQADAATTAANEEVQAAQTAGQQQLLSSQQSLALQNQQYNQGLSSIYQGANAALQTQLPYEEAGLNALQAYDQSMGLNTPQGGYLAANPPISSLTAPTPQGVPVLGSTGQPATAGTTSTGTSQPGALTASGGTPTGSAAAAASVTGFNGGASFLHDTVSGPASGGPNAANLQSSQDLAFQSGYQNLIQQALTQSGGNLANLTSAQQATLNTGYQNLLSSQGVADTGGSPAPGETYTEQQFLNQNSGFGLNVAGTNFAQQLMANPSMLNGATYNAGTPANTGGAAAQMGTSLAGAPAAAASSQGALDEYFNSPEYQLIFGAPSAGQLAGTSTPQQNFEQSPSYQFQLAQGLNSVTNSAAASGLLNSTSLANGIDTYAQGFAGEQFNNYLTNLQGNFSSYQGQLANAAGAGQTAANNATNVMTGTGNAASGVAGTAAASEGNTIAQSGTNQANSTIAAGNAAATGTVGAANANTAASNSAASLGGLLGQSSGLFGGGSSSSSIFGGSSSPAPVEEGVDTSGDFAGL